MMTANAIVNAITSAAPSVRVKDVDSEAATINVGRALLRVCKGDGAEWFVYGEEGKLLKRGEPQHIASFVIGASKVAARKEEK